MDEVAKYCFFDNCCSTLGLVKATTVNLDDNDYYQYVPILPSLSSYLQHQDVQSAIFHSKITGMESQLCCFADGSFFKNHS